jgi:hypothetical protein
VPGAAVAVRVRVAEAVLAQLTKLEVPFQLTAVAPAATDCAAPSRYKGNMCFVDMISLVMS